MIAQAKNISEKKRIYSNAGYHFGKIAQADIA